MRKDTSRFAPQEGVSTFKTSGIVMFENRKRSASASNRQDITKPVIQGTVPRKSFRRPREENIQTNDILCDGEVDRDENHTDCACAFSSPDEMPDSNPCQRFPDPSSAISIGKCHHRRRPGKVLSRMR